MKRRSFKSFLCVVVPSVFICFSVYTITGVFGYLRFTPGCIASDIMRNYCQGDIPVDVARGMLAVVIVTSYPILTFCGRYVRGVLTALEFEQSPAFCEVYNNNSKGGKILFVTFGVSFISLRVTLILMK